MCVNAAIQSSIAMFNKLTNLLTTAVHLQPSLHSCQSDFWQYKVLVGHRHLEVLQVVRTVDQPDKIEICRGLLFRQLRVFFDV